LELDPAAVEVGAVVVARRNRLEGA
jgi:hypothetical protein